jgi:hypothetical protein
VLNAGDESCVYGCDLKMKQQSSQWKIPGSPRLKKAHQTEIQQEVHDHLLYPVWNG